MAVSPTNGDVYVVNSNPGGSGTVSVIEPGGTTVSATIDVGTLPVAVAVNPTTGDVYVANADNDSVSVIDPATDTVTGTIADIPGGSIAVAVSPTTGDLYVVGGGSTVSKFS